MYTHTHSLTDSMSPSHSLTHPTTCAYEHTYAGHIHMYFRFTEILYRRYEIVILKIVPGNARVFTFPRTLSLPLAIAESDVISILPSSVI